MAGGQPGGGSLQLGKLIDDHGDLLLADFRSYYSGLDLTDLFDPESSLGPLQVLTLIKELPVDSRFYAEKRGGPHFRGWDESRYAMAAVVNAVRALQHALLLINTEKSKRGKIPVPELYPLPEMKALKKQHKPGSFGAIVAGWRQARKRRAESNG